MKKALTPHPGEHLLKEFMQPYGLSSNALARALLVTPARINEIVRGKRGISADTALRLARFFNCDVQMWMDLQNQYELGQSGLSPCGWYLAALGTGFYWRYLQCPRAKTARGICGGFAGSR